MDEVMKNEIKAFIDEALKKQDDIIKNYISSNSTLIYETLNKIQASVEAIGKRVAKVEETIKEHGEKIKDIEKSLEFTQELVDQKIADLDNHWESKIIQQVATAKEESRFLRNKLRTLEDRNRRNNLRVEGVTENDNETWEDSENKVKDIIKEQMGIDEELKIERAHRIGKKENGKKRAIIFKLESWKQKEMILKKTNKLKNTGLYINEDFSDETMLIRKELFKEMKIKRDEGKFAKVVYDKLVVRNFRQPRQ